MSNQIHIIQNAITTTISEIFRGEFRRIGNCPTIRATKLVFNVYVETVNQVFNKYFD